MGGWQLIGVRTSAVDARPLRSSFHAVVHVAIRRSRFTDTELEVKWVESHETVLVKRPVSASRADQLVHDVNSPELSTRADYACSRPRCRMRKCK